MDRVNWFSFILILFLSNYSKIIHIVLYLNFNFNLSFVDQNFSFLVNYCPHQDHFIVILFHSTFLDLKKHSYQRFPYFIPIHPFLLKIIHHLFFILTLHFIHLVYYCNDILLHGFQNPFMNFVIQNCFQIFFQLHLLILITFVFEVRV